MRYPIERFDSKWMPEPNTGCWIWFGGHNEHGYGIVSFRSYGRKITVKAHRLSYELRVADPGSLFVCHRCDTPECVNPDHLFLGTQSDNMKDCAAKKRNAAQSKPERLSRGDNHWTRKYPGKAAKTAKRGSDHPMAKLDEGMVADIRARIIRGERQNAIAASLGVSKSTINLIALGKIWRH